jgi:hypothetical protein
MSATPATPSAIVDLQTRAYNERDIDAYCALFAEDARIYRLNQDRPIASGIEQIRKYYTVRFQNPHLHCVVTSRMLLQDFVIDYESVVGVGEGTLHVIAIYEVRNSRIQTLHIVWPEQ